MQYAGGASLPISAFEPPKYQLTPDLSPDIEVGDASGCKAGHARSGKAACDDKIARLFEKQAFILASASRRHIYQYGQGCGGSGSRRTRATGLYGTETRGES